MQVKELRRKEKQTGETIVDIKADKLLVRLISTYSNGKTLEEMIYILACCRLEDKIA